MAHCSIHKLQQLRMLGRQRCRVVYMARSACGWLMIADIVGSCSQQPSADLLPDTPGCVVAAAEDEYSQSEFNALRGAQPMQALKQCR